MPNASAMSLQDSRPSIKIDGQLDGALASSLQAMDLLDSSDGMARCELLLANWGGPSSPGFQYFDRQKLEFGKRIAVLLGSDALFEGRITVLSACFPDGGTAQFGICAEDNLQDLRMTRRTRCFENVSLTDVGNRIAGEHGLQFDGNLSGAQHKILTQLNQSDLAFLRDLGRREDVQFWVDSGKLKAASRAQRSGAAVELTWAGTLREFRVSADLAHQRTGLAACGWDVADKSAATHTADETAIRAEVGSRDSGVATLARAFGTRVDTLAHGLAFDAGEARALAESSLRHLARRFVVGHGVAQTRADLRVGCALKLAGIGPLFEGEYTATRVRHRFDGRAGLRTEFECDRPAVGQGQ